MHGDNFSKFNKTRTCLAWEEDYALWEEHTLRRALASASTFENTSYLGHKCKRLVLNGNFDLELCARRFWPIFLSYEEGATFMKHEAFSRKTSTFLITSDTTNAPLPKPSDTNEKCSLWSDYCIMTCAKGGPMGRIRSWISLTILVTGSMDDSTCAQARTALEKQKKFQAHCKVGEFIAPFLSVLNEGHCLLHLTNEMEKTHCNLQSVIRGST